MYINSEFADLALLLSFLTVKGLESEGVGTVQVQGVPVPNQQNVYIVIVFASIRLKVHKNENLSASDFEFCTISLLVMLKY
jgi:hypothetical protein